MASFIQSTANKLQSSSFAESNGNNLGSTNRLKKGTSLDSINAVERELDEVLKDLEMNSSDLNLVSEQMNNASLIQQSVHLPITIHQSHIKQQAQQSIIPSLSSSSFINSNSNKTINSEFLSSSTSTTNQAQSAANNNNLDNNSTNSIRLNREASMSTDAKRRQNIVSTYEICQECFDVNNVNTGCSQHPQNRYSKQQLQQQTTQKAVSSDFTPILSNLTENQIFNSNKQQQQQQQHQMSSLSTSIPLKITLSSSSFSSPSQDGVPKQTNGLTSSSSSALTTTATTNGKPPIAVRLNKSNSVLVNNSNNNNNNNNNNKTILHQTPRQATVQKSVTISEKSPSPKFNGSRNRSTSSHYNNNNNNGVEESVENNKSAWSTTQNSLNSTTSSLRKKFQTPNFNSVSTFTNTNNNNNMNGTSSSSNETLCKYNNNNNNNNGGVDCELSINEPFETTTTNRQPQFINNNRNYDNVINYPTDDDKCEKVEIIVNKDHRYNDYGFSIADSLFGKGVFVNKVRISNQYPYLQPYTQIFRVC